MYTRKTLFGTRCKAGLASLIISISFFLAPVLSFAQQQYQGAEFCKDCHEQPYNEWTASGHPYKLMKGQEARYRPIPLPGGFNWPDSDVLESGDVSYVIGGYKWKSRYMDHEGYIITTTCEEREPFEFGCDSRAGVNQYNYLTGEWVDYHAGEDKVPYDCGSCHTTNWVADEDAETDNDLSDNQDGLPGIWGTFDAGGIQCEQCHGNSGGATHMSGQIDDSAEACGVCHYREAPPGSAVNVIPAGGGFIKHHEQYNENLAGPHSAMKCVTCHNPHKRGEFSIKEGRSCETCHGAIATTFMETPMAGYGVECIDCHMPAATKSANQLGPFEGDVQTHLFYINTDETANMFTEDGSYVALDFAVPGKPTKVNKGAATLDFACKTCHETAEMAELGRHAKNFHGTEMVDGNPVPELEYIGINPGLTGTWWGGMDRNGEGFVMDVTNSNGVTTLFVSFYTYDDQGNQVWLIAVGPANTGMTSTVNVYIAGGRKWGEDGNQADFTTLFGTGEFTFTSCDGGMFTITPTQDFMNLGFTSIGYDLNRDGIDYQIACPTFVNEATAN